MANGLTQKQEKFCQDVFSGFNYTDAYRRNYNVKLTTLPASVNRKAFEVMENVKVSARINELKSMAVSSKVMTVLERKERLTKIALDTNDNRTAIQAINALNDMEQIGKQAILQQSHDNRQINIYIAGEQSKSQLNKLLSGEPRRMLKQGDETIEPDIIDGCTSIVER